MESEAKRRILVAGRLDASSSSNCFNDPLTRQTKVNREICNNKTSQELLELKQQQQEQQSSLFHSRKHRTHHRVYCHFPDTSATVTDSQLILPSRSVILKRDNSRKISYNNQQYEQEQHVCNNISITSYSEKESLDQDCVKKDHKISRQVIRNLIDSSSVKRVVTAEIHQQQQQHHRPYFDDNGVMTVAEPDPDYDDDVDYDDETEPGGTVRNEQNSCIVTTSDELHSVSTDEGIESSQESSIEKSVNITKGSVLRKSLRFAETHSSLDSSTDPASNQSKRDPGKDEDRVVRMNQSNDQTMRHEGRGSSKKSAAPPPPPPPPLPVTSQQEQQTIGNHSPVAREKERKLTSELNSLTTSSVEQSLVEKEQEESAKAKVMRKPSAAVVTPAFMPPFLTPPDSDINIKPSEYLRKIAAHKQLHSRNNRLGEKSEPSPGEKATSVRKTASENHLMDSQSDSNDATVRDVTPNGFSSVEAVKKMQTHSEETSIESGTSWQTRTEDTDCDQTMVRKNDVIEELKNGKNVKGTKKVQRNGTDDAQNSKTIQAVLMMRPEDFLEKIPDKTASGAPVPHWKRLMIAKKMAEKAKQEAECQETLNAESRKQIAMPEWKRNILNKRGQRNGTSENENKNKKDSQENMENESGIRIIRTNGDSSMNGSNSKVWSFQLRKTNSIFW